jgi:hypothetical protein
MTSIEISYKKVRDGYPLRLWKATTEIDAEPDAIMRRIVYERYVKERTHFAGVLCSHAWVYLAQWCSPGMLTRGALQKCPELVGGRGGYNIIFWKF